ncbi:MAG: glutamate-5-semialdehyde dehydrogenase [Leptolinea sp.]|jgi:glutamate-5-semialdehyde dehydrogenase|nr:glutamate-5-semialdehyde dehydrogenase [Leptolinea sp.]
MPTTSPLALAQAARTAFHTLATSGTSQRETALNAIANEIESSRDLILSANKKDVENGTNTGLAAAFIDRLMLNEERLGWIITDLRHVAALPDPVGEIFDEQVMPNGLKIRKQRVPLGVLAVIYEARPNVTVDAAGLAIKSGNAVILRGSSETLNSNRALVSAIKKGLAASGLPEGGVQFVDSPSRELVLEMLKLHDEIDMIIPRGGSALHNFCRENSLIPVITGGIGICHLYVDASADLERALPVIRNAKIQRPSVCNALDTLLVHNSVAARFIPRVVDTLARDGVSFRVDEKSARCLPDLLPKFVQIAKDHDFDTEWLSLVLGIRVVSSLDEAIEHIAVHSTAHSDGILTEDADNAAAFIARVDSAAVYVNASTRFTDGSQLGLGAEVAISTQRLHARGPMALRELTTYKWVIQGDYHARP